MPDRISLQWHRRRVAGRNAAYLEAGTGPTAVFLHGWGLSHRAYRGSVKHLAGMGLRVLAPALPGFSGTAGLPADECTLSGYAAWVVAFIQELGVNEPVLLVGHSFGGGVAIVVAHEHSDHVGALVLVNSIGGGVWRDDGELTKAMSDRPLWSWGLHFSRDVRGVSQLTRVLPVVLSEALPNLILDPKSFVRSARLAKTADLSDELDDLRRRGLPVVVIWSPRDQVVTDASIEALRGSLGRAKSISVPGGHSWLLADPDQFAEVMTNVVQVAERARWSRPPGRARKLWRRARAAARPRSRR